MSHSTILRHSKAHRAAVARNSAKFVRRIAITMSIEQFTEMNMSAVLRNGVKVLRVGPSNFGMSRCLDIEAPLNFDLTRNLPFATIKKDEKVRIK